MDIKIKQTKNSSLTIVKGRRTRFLYTLIFFVLTATVLLSIDKSIDFKPKRIGGTLFTFSLVLVSLTLSVLVKTYTIDIQTRLLNQNIGLPLGLYNRVVKQYPMGSSPVLIIDSLNGESKKTVSSPRIPGMVMVANKTGFKLSLETAEKTIPLFTSSDKEDIIQCTQTISDCLGIPVRNYILRSPG